MFGSCFKTSLLKNKYDNTGMIAPIATNGVIYRMWCFHKIPKVGKKPHGMTFYIKINMVTMDMFKNEKVKNSKSTGELRLSQYYQATSEV